MRVVGETLIPVTGMLLTVMVEVEVKPPDTVVAVMVTVPAVTPVTSPVAFTVATAVLLELQFTFWFVAFEGVMVFDSWLVAPAFKVTVEGETETPVTGMATVTDEVFVKLPETVVPVIVADPTPTAVTNPEPFTVATLVLSDIQFTF